MRRRLTLAALVEMLEAGQFSMPRGRKRAVAEKLARMSLSLLSQERFRVRCTCSTTVRPLFLHFSLLSFFFVFFPFLTRIVTRINSNKSRTRTHVRTCVGLGLPSSLGFCNSDADQSSGLLAPLPLPPLPMYIPPSLFCVPPSLPHKHMQILVFKLVRAHREMCTTAWALTCTCCLTTDLSS